MSARAAQPGRATPSDAGPQPSADRGAARALCLAIDTATRTSIVALGSSEVLARSQREVRHRHGSVVLAQIDEVLESAAASLDEIAAVAVGTGPGSFTGLRVGLATAKTLAHARGLPILGISSAAALRTAAEAAGAPRDAAVVLPAGAHDHYLVREGLDPELVAPGDLDATLAGAEVIAVDLGEELLGAHAARLGEAAVGGMAAALLALAVARLEAGERDDLATLVPVYVALPRGVRQAPEELGWSPDLR